MNYPHEMNDLPRLATYTPEPDPKKRMPSCDLCRLRKIKCVKNPGSKCEGCISLDQECEYTHIRRKPGPPNKFARRKSDPNALPPSHFPPHAAPVYPLRMPADHQPWLPPSHALQYPLTAPPITFNHSHILTDQPSDRAGLPYLPLPPALLTAPMASVNQSTAHPTSWAWGAVETGWNSSDVCKEQHLSKIPSNGPRTSRDTASHEWDIHQRRAGSAHKDLPPSPDDRTRPKTSDYQRPLYRVEDAIEWGVMMRILHAYRAHLYPLMPIVHWPTFSQQLIDRADEQSESWRAFLFALIAYSIIQLPRSTISFLSVDQLRSLHQRCFQASQRLQNRKYKEVKLVDLKTLYCQHVYLGSLGDQGASVIALSKAVSLSFMLGLHDESRLPAGINPIDREVRRRVLWLIYGSDRTDTALAGDPLLISDDELNLPLPLPVDDDLLTASGVVDQPKTSVLAGFHFNSRLFRLLGSVLSELKSVSATSKNPLTDPYPILRLPQGRVWIRPSSQFHEELESLLDELPVQLQLSTHHDTLDSGTSPSHAEDNEAAFASCRANLLITQAMTRFAIRKYAKAIGDEEAEGDCKDWAEKDVLGLLERMSPESLAANGNAMRVKLLFVTSALMEKYPVNTDGHNYVADFLNVYTRAAEEQSLAMLEVDSLLGSREPSPELSFLARAHQSFERTIPGKEGQEVVQE